MTITLHWWLIPLALVVGGFIIFISLEQKGDHDFFTPILAVAALLGGIGLAIAFMIGRWMK